MGEHSCLPSWGITWHAQAAAAQSDDQLGGGGWGMSALLG